ncbi:MAG: CpsD/CapB family tyrosine-protein kinase [Candidatus Methylomirabilia bacterium]
MAEQLTDAGARKAKKGKMPVEIWGSLGEEFRSLRTRVAAALKERHKIVLVTSALPQEGKTTVSATLARSFAQMEWRTLLVDADLRKPTMHTLFGIDRAPGLTDLLQGIVPEEEAIAVSNSPFLDLLSAGSPTQSAAELLQSTATPTLLKSLAARYDYVVVDTTPLTSITDAHLLSGYVDGILFVVDGQVSPREFVKSAREQLQDRPVLGVVLNGISTPKKYGYYY